MYNTKVYGLIERDPLVTSARYVATDMMTGKQFVKEYTLRDVFKFNGYNNMIYDMTGSSDSSKFILRVLPNQVKLPFYVYDPYKNEVSIHVSAADFADENRLGRTAVSLALSKKQKQASGFRLWYVGDVPPEFIRYGVERGEEVHKADTWEELGLIIDVSRQALSNGYREGRNVMGWHVFKETLDLAKMMACFEVKQEFEESVDIIQNPCYHEQEKEEV
ncbi:hypothetical protein BCPG1_088 [Bacillus phage BCPG1]|uniref:Uncharacterized protein n=1 Tax=Bacillus phage SalinJah TaxID=1837830 RepID=A0A173GB18_9CAUD|nr:hypothetical protein SALINJAH_161 [Bacillus phage SalinJah]ANH50581.1 hypothetical protein SALINJAH_161 [Bacillus phage SalinJah]QQO38819.1 hypothetical protein BCPG1_088 [Bacillus phage BCPG1]QSJ04696.1 hypothetical protein BCP18_164 [Bacillus phage BCP18]